MVHTLLHHTQEDFSPYLLLASMKSFNAAKSLNGVFPAGIAAGAGTIGVAGTTGGAG